MSHILELLLETEALYLKENGWRKAGTSRSWLDSEGETFNQAEAVRRQKQKDGYLPPNVPASML